MTTNITTTTEHMEPAIQYWDSSAPRPAPAYPLPTMLGILSSMTAIETNKRYLILLIDEYRRILMADILPATAESVRQTEDLRGQSLDAALMFPSFPDVIAVGRPHVTLQLPYETFAGSGETVLFHGLVKVARIQQIQLAERQRVYYLLVEGEAASDQSPTRSLEEMNVPSAELRRSWDTQAHILIVEDEPKGQLWLLQTLQRLGCTNITIANNGKEALKRLESDDFDLIYMDGCLPDMSGSKIIQYIRAQEETATIPIIGVTGDPAAQGGMFAAGVNVYCSKPARLEDIEATLFTYARISPFDERLARLITTCLEAKELDKAVEMMRTITNIPEVLMPFFSAVKADDLAQMQNIASSGIELGDDDVAEALFSIFQAIVRNDHHQVRWVLHKLKSAAAFLGAHQLLCHLQALHNHVSSAEVSMEAMDLTKMVKVLKYYSRIRPCMERKIATVQQMIATGDQYAAPPPVETTDIPLSLRTEIWIADDAFNSRTTMEVTVRQTHPETVVQNFKNGREVIEALEAIPAGSPFPDMIFLDLDMPEVDGFAVLKYVKASWPSIKVVIITQLSASDDDQDFSLKFKELTDFGCDGFIGKKEGPSEFFQMRVASYMRDLHAHKKLMHEKMYDGLTGLLGGKKNEDLLEECFEQTLTRVERRGTQGAIIFLDLDQFKPVNDTHGHAAGDQILKEAATRLQGCVRASDLVASYGGDEFLIILEDITPDEGAQNILDKILTAFEIPFTIQDTQSQTRQISVGITAGMKVFPLDGRKYSALKEAADQDMLAQKRGKKAQR